MDALLREKMTQLTTKCDILQKNVLSALSRESMSNASILWRRLSASRRMFMAWTINNSKPHHKNYVST